MYTKKLTQYIRNTYLSVWNVVIVYRYTKRTRFNASCQMSEIIFRFSRRPKMINLRWMLNADAVAYQNLILLFAKRMTAGPSIYYQLCSRKHAIFLLLVCFTYRNSIVYLVWIILKPTSELTFSIFNRTDNAISRRGSRRIHVSKTVLFIRPEQSLIL